MVAATLASVSAPVAGKTVTAPRKAFSGLPVAPRLTRKVQRVNKNVVASAQTEKLAAAVTVAAASAMMHPAVAEAAVTPSVKNLLLSVIAGGTVLTVIVVGISVVANFDPISRQ